MCFLFDHLLLVSILLLIICFLLSPSLVLSSFWKSGTISEGRPRISPWAACVQLLCGRSGCESLQNDRVSHHRLVHIFELAITK